MIELPLNKNNMIFLIEIKGSMVNSETILIKPFRYIIYSRLIATIFL